eukprot:jgi/Galph1/585/GphlegSOOS_G5412.1
MQQPFVLSTELRGHESEVRAVLVVSDDILVTGSRDCTLKWWERSEQVNKIVWQLKNSVHLNNSFISCLALLFGDGSCPLVASGAGDGNICLWNGLHGERVTQVKGHENNVCHIAVGSNHNFVSCSWDHTSVLWRWMEQENGIEIQQVQILKGHQAAVWNETGECLQTLQGHSDVVRGLCKEGNDESIISISNDGYAIRWKPSEKMVEGHCLPFERDNEIFLSNHFLYCLTYLPSLDLFACGGEEGSVKIFSFESGCLQTISHPSTVWALSSFPNEDLVTGCMDAVCRIFTQDESRKAEEVVLQEFETSASTKKLTFSAVGNIDWNQLPTYEQVVSTRGTQEGQLKVVRIGKEAQVLIWNEANQQWSKFGDVIDYPEQADGGIQSGYLENEYYDYIFDVDIGENQPKRKLGYRKGENPLTAAQRFLLKEELPLEYIDQVAEFIDKNTGYSLSNSAHMASDPLTGTSRYIPSENHQKASTSSASNVLTENTYQPTDNEKETSATKKHFPIHQYIYFKYSDQFDTMRKKLHGYNEQVETPLTSEALQLIVSGVITKLKQQKDSSIIFSEEELQNVEKLLDWPTNKIVPVLDIFRLMILSPSASSYFFLKNQSIGLQKVLEHVQSPQATMAVWILACRVFCNMFSNRLVSLIACEKWEIIHQVFPLSSMKTNTKAKETYSSLLHNFGIRLSEEEGQFANTKRQWIATCLQWLLLLDTVSVEEERKQNDVHVYSIMVALGTVCYSHPWLLREAIENYNLLDVLSRFASTDRVPLKECLQQMERMIAQ